MSTPNTSKFSDESTARTCMDCAIQRAENLFLLGATSVLELCVGPSLQALERAYRSVGITNVTGNDIDPRWKKYYPKGNWLLGDARTMDVSNYDAAVVAPPLSKFCSGRREDSLSLEQVTPSYYGFTNLNCRVTVYVLPGKTLSLKEDRGQLHKFLSSFSGKETYVVPLKFKNKVVKYVDVYVVNNKQG